MHWRCRKMLMTVCVICWFFFIAKLQIVDYPSYIQGSELGRLYCNLVFLYVTLMLFSLPGCWKQAWWAICSAFVSYLFQNYSCQTNYFEIYRPNFAKFSGLVALQLWLYMINQKLVFFISQATLPWQLFFCWFYLQNWLFSALLWPVVQPGGLILGFTLHLVAVKCYPHWWLSGCLLVIRHEFFGPRVWLSTLSVIQPCWRDLTYGIMYCIGLLYCIQLVFYSNCSSKMHYLTVFQIRHRIDRQIDTPQHCLMPSLW